MLIRTATLYTRDRESVLLAVDQTGRVWRLMVLGPGEASNTYDFDEPGALTVFQRSLERDLIDRGFHVQATADRRTGTDRRLVSRSEVRDRRRPHGE